MDNTESKCLCMLFAFLKEVLLLQVQDCVPIALCALCAAPQVHCVPFVHECPFGSWKNSG